MRLRVSTLRYRWSESAVRPSDYSFDYGADRQGILRLICYRASRKIPRHPAFYSLVLLFHGTLQAKKKGKTSSMVSPSESRKLERAKHARATPLEEGSLLRFVSAARRQFESRDGDPLLLTSRNEAVLAYVLDDCGGYHSIDSLLSPQAATLPMSCGIRG